MKFSDMDKGNTPDVAVGVGARELDVHQHVVNLQAENARLRGLLEQIIELGNDLLLAETFEDTYPIAAKMDLKARQVDW